MARRTSRFRAAALVAAALTLLTIVSPAGAAARRPFELKLRVNSLPTLEGSFYEVWVVRGDDKLSAGGFNVAEDGSLQDGFGHPARFFSDINPRSADAIVVTIEPLPDPDLGPSGIIVLSGEPGRRGARLSFPVSFEGASGSFILATPTDDQTNNETAGIWFLDPATGPGPSLQLPQLPEGWVFEGWGVTQGTPLTTGRFTSASGADSFDGFSGPNAGPPFPGEDFLNNLPSGVTPPVNLADGSSMAVVTVEPDLGGEDPTGAGPFSIKPLVGAISAGAPDHQSISLSLDTSSVPSGRATF